MKKIIAIILALSFVFSMAACGSKTDPKDVVQKYCEAMKKYDTQTMASCMLNPGADEGEALEEDYGDFAGFIDYFKECASQETYEILDSAVSENKGTVSVKFNYVDATNLVSETFQSFLINALGLAFSNADEEEIQKVFFETFDQKKDIIKTGTSQATVVFYCTNTDAGWLIDETPEEIIDILSCNANKAFEGFQNAFNDADSNNKTPSSNSSNSVKIESWNDIQLGETAELATLKITATACEEVKELGNNWTNIQADPGTKFVVYTVTLENITKQAITFNADMLLQDGQERQYSVYDKGWMYVDEAFFYTELAPNIKKTGYFIYQLPEDSTNYYFMCAKSGTNEGYRFWG